ncbi:MAG TPA: hypothetical protein PLT71_11045 [Bacteroidales bacterium]|nr:hypothetical protein [Bacteroidales bacterium]
MKRLYTIAIVFLLTASYASAQRASDRCWHLDKIEFLQLRQDFWRTHRLYSAAARPLSEMTGGFYNLTEAQYGFGLKEIDEPFAEYYAGITNTLGWRFGSGIALGGGIGYYQYNGGYDIPIFGDERWYLGRQRVKFFLMGTGGFMANFKNFKDLSRVFVNPGAGLTVPIAKNLHLSFAAGMLTQWDRNIFEDGPGYRDSFINMKLGLLYQK